MHGKMRRSGLKENHVFKNVRLNYPGSAYPAFVHPESPRAHASGGRRGHRLDDYNILCLQRLLLVMNAINIWEVLHDRFCPLALGRLFSRSQRFSLSLSFFFFFFSFCLVRATPAACGGSEVRGGIQAVAAGLCHSHSHARSEPHLQPTP